VICAAEIPISAAEIKTCRTEITISQTEIATSQTEIAISRTEIAISRTEIAISRTEITISRTEIATSRTEITISRTEIATSRTGIAIYMIGIAIHRSEITCSYGVSIVVHQIVFAHRFSFPARRVQANQPARLNFVRERKGEGKCPQKPGPKIVPQHPVLLSVNVPRQRRPPLETLSAQPPE
jgi:uncharacterized membrane protein YidH (DUF202 family)